MSPGGGLRLAEVQDSSSYLNRSLGSVASASIRVGDLVRQAMTFFETDRKAWRGLSDASTLLGADVPDLGVDVPRVDKPQPGGLTLMEYVVVTPLRRSRSRIATATCR
jgi:hypothetical protein